MSFRGKYMIAALAIGVLIIIWSLIRRDHSRGSRINLDDLVLGEDGKLSKAAFVMIGSFIMTTWVIVWLTWKDKLTEGYFTAYLTVWVIPAVTKLIKGQAAQTTSETLISSTTVTPSK